MKFSVAIIALLGGALTLLCAGAVARPAPRPKKTEAHTEESAPAHRSGEMGKPLPWPGGVVPYELSKLTEAQRAKVLSAMKRRSRIAMRSVPSFVKPATRCTRMV